MKQWRATYYIPNGKSEHKDFYAETKEEAWKIAYKPDMRAYGYTDMILREIKEGLKRVGMQVEMSYDESRCKSGFINATKWEYVFIEANSEKDAIDIYNSQYKNHWCDSNGKLAEDGYRKYGKIIKSYYC